MLKIFILLIFLNKNSAQECGVPKIGIGNIIGGNNVIRGQFPWMSAIFKIDVRGDYNLICGGNLVSNKHVLTAAHCILNKDQVTPLLPRETLIILGAHDLDKRFESGRETISTVQIIVHPDWNQYVVNFDADIAIIVLERQVLFNDYIKPICLLNFNNNDSPSRGVVVGYGKSEDQTKKHENLPKKIEVPIHSQEDCFLTKPDLVKISSTRTFCGGFGDGTGVCSGDSGGGLFIKINEVYYLRGIVSSSLLTNDYQCDVNSYSIYTNVFKYKDWIQSTMRGASFKNFNDDCGMMSQATGLIGGGEFSTRKEFPWVASIVIKNGGFNSTGVLVSNRHVITDPIGVSGWNKDLNKLVPNELSRVKVYFAALQDGESNTYFDVVKIVLHPQLRSVDDTRINDVAVVTLDRPVKYNEFIRPICLWSGSDDLNLIKNSPIYAVGYGRDDTGEYSKVKKHAKVTLADQDDCEKYYSKYQNFFSQTKAFCVYGSAKGVPCERDVYLFVKYLDRWFIRGILKRFPVHDNIRACKSNEPFLYEDDAKHVKWIQTQIEI